MQTKAPFKAFLKALATALKFIYNLTDRRAIYRKAHQHPAERTRPKKGYHY